MHVSEIALDVTLLIACGMLVVAFSQVTRCRGETFGIGVTNFVN